MITDFYRGDSKTWTVRVNLLPLDAGECWITLKTDRDDADSAAVFQTTATFSIDSEDTSKVRAELNLPVADSELLLGKYYYDIQGVSADKSIVMTLLSGTVTVLKDTTRTI
jgi:hypothetical protein